MSECSLVHEPCRRPEKIGGLAQVLQRRTPTWGDRPTDADYVAESRWRSQPAVVNEPENSTRRRSKVRPHCRAGKLYPPAIQSSASLQVLVAAIARWMKVQWQVKANPRLDPSLLQCTRRSPGTPLTRTSPTTSSLPPAITVAQSSPSALATCDPVRGL